MSHDLERAIRGYKAFREAQPRRAQRYSMELPGAVWRMGVCEFIGYMTTHNGKPALYVHEFAAGSRPVLYAGPGRSQLYLVGGRFVVNGHGITDLDSQGRVTEAPRRWHTARRRNPRQRSGYRLTTRPGRCNLRPVSRGAAHTLSRART